MKDFSIQPDSTYFIDTNGHEADLAFGPGLPHNET